MQTITINMVNHQVLFEEAKKVSIPLDQETEKFIAEFQKYFEEEYTDRAVGLAATQVGKPISVAIVEVSEDQKAKRKCVGEPLERTVFLNPTYEPIETEGEYQDWEGCLSIPDQLWEVYRYNTIRFHAYKLVEGGKVEKVDRRVSGFLARVLQHESDHLRGVLCSNPALCRKGCRHGSVEDMQLIREKDVQAWRKAQEDQKGNTPP